MYHYDAFGNEKNPVDTDPNPFRYCGEYWDDETQSYYLRARYYNPVSGRFTAQDRHWNPSNMLYGDSPVKINERKDALGLTVYTYVPDIAAIMQSSNLYIYCMNNPIMYQDYNGEFALPALAAAGVAGGVLSGSTAVAGTNFWNPIGWVAAGVAVLLVGAIVGVGIYNAKKNKPPNLPSHKKVEIDMDHIMSGHGAGGNRGGPNKDRFPWGMTAAAIEKAIREAYRYAEKIGSVQKVWENGVEMTRQMFQGPWGERTIQFWYNYTTKTIETAWPK